MSVFSITDIPEFSKKQRIVVVGFIGKSPYRYPNKTVPLVSAVQSEENGIECHWDERRGVVYLHAVTYLDTKRLVQLAAELDENSKSTEKDADAAHWLVASGELAVDSSKIIALLFQLCHIVVLSSPTSTFDLGYLQLFKAIDAYRTELAPSIAAALSEIKAGGTWESHGRTCCPRLLFHFRRAPTPLRGNPASLKKLEHATEDQLYYILRKARIITNVCAKSLFAIPKNEEFVYMSGDGEVGSARDVSALVRGLVARCAGADPAQLGATPAGADTRATFRAFLQGHIERAAHDGFDDNVGKYAMTTSFFELPSAASWREAARALAPVFLATPAPPTGALFTALATDVRFSAARCAKVLPLAQASYAESLPSHYASQHHAHKVKVALGVMASMARGPLCAGAAARLRAACAAAYAGRTLCEAPSLTGHGCVLPDHDSSVEHSSGVRYVSACECGRKRVARDDPYSVRAANCAYYAAAADLCDGCRTAERHHFPVFEPSTPTFRAASVKGGTSQECEAGGRDSEAESPGSGSGWSREALSPGPAPEDDDDDQDQYVLHERRDCHNDKAVTRQASTTEYLPGLLHVGSPAGLLPRHQHWSLLCLGPSSLYSHALGLPEHLQPGFLPHTNYLLPWDCAPRVEQISLFRAALGRGRGKSAPPHITVKIFIGFEYECLRGHRFMMSSPESVTAGGGSAAAGAALAAADMPVYVGCVCRAPPAAPLAALTRLHVVTPKAPLHVTLQPRVQPVPGGPTFVPQPAGSAAVKLSPSAYWILRLPYMYADERGPLPRPRAPPPLHSAGRILAPIFGLVE